MPDYTAKLARAARTVLRQQQTLAEQGKEKFGTFDRKLAEVLLPGILALWKLEMRRLEADLLMLEEAEVRARQRALQTAQDINDSTQQMLEQGQEPETVFSVDRAARIGVTEASEAKHAAMGAVAYDRGEKLRWRNGPKPCAECRSLNGQVRKPGQPFVTKSGKKILNPPAHPHCFCTTEIVKGRARKVG